MQVLDPKCEGIEYTKEIFRCLLLAQESPNIFELAIIADLPIEERNDEVALRRCVSRCGAFVTISDNEEPTVDWIDTAAKEYLEENAKNELSLDLSEVQHGIIALRCLDYLRGLGVPEEQQQIAENLGFEAEENRTNEGYTVSDENEHSEANPYASQVEEMANTEQSDLIQTQQVQTNSTPPGPIYNDQETDAAFDNDDLDSEIYGDHEEPLYYPSLYWLDHAKLAPPDLVHEFDLSDEFWSENSKSRVLWWRRYAGENGLDDLTGITSLHVSALEGYSELVNYLLVNGHEDEIHKADSWGRSPFFWACEHGDLDMVCRLLEAGADVNASGALCAASSEGHQKSSNICWNSNRKLTSKMNFMARHCTLLLKMETQTSSRSYSNSELMLIWKEGYRDGH